MGPDEPSLSDSGLIRAVGRDLLGRVRGVARGIEARVRRVLSPVAPLRVLVVDDEPDTADALAAVLRLLGHDARAYYDAPSALAAAAGFRPDACLLDLLMPGVDGFELAGRLKSQAAPPLLVATTALGGPEDLARSAAAGFDYHLVKPVDPGVLLAALSKLAGPAGPEPGGADDTKTDRPPLPPGG
jgi:CheY-like chemotaxis protein